MTQIFEWPPLRDWGRFGMPGICTGACFFDGVEVGPLEWGWRRRARAHMGYDSRGRLTQMQLDLDADGTVDQTLAFDVAYDDAGRLVHEQYLGAWSIVTAEYAYECGG